MIQGTDVAQREQVIDRRNSVPYRDGGEKLQAHSEDADSSAMSRRNFLKQLSGGAAAIAVGDTLLEGSSVQAANKTADDDQATYPLTKETGIFSRSKWIENRDIEALLQLARLNGYLPLDQVDRFREMALRNNDFENTRKIFSAVDQFSHNPDYRGEYRLDQKDIHELLRKVKDVAAALKPMSAFVPKKYVSKEGKPFQINGLTKKELIDYTADMKDFPGLEDQYGQASYREAYGKYQDYVYSNGTESVLRRLGLTHDELIKLLASRR